MQYKDSKISQRLKTLRKELKLSQTDFGKKIGKNYHSVMRWELGRVNPPSNVIDHICDSFGVNKDWLILGEGEMFAEKDTHGVAEDEHLYDASSYKIKIESQMSCVAGKGSSPPVLEGDIIYFKAEETDVTDGLYLIEDKYGDTYARWKKDDMWLSKLEDYPDIPFRNAKIIGKITKIIREIDF